LTAGCGTAKLKTNVGIEKGRVVCLVDLWRGDGAFDRKEVVH